jgi:hypothetical protein
MDSQLLETLLNEDESTTLDFKRDQYPFDGATDEQKSELLKDILAFANAWRRTDAYILIGAEEVRGGRSRPVGIPKHLDDASLQQFVNSKCNRPVVFRYEVVSIDQVEIGSIHIPIQERPFYLNKDYGKLKKDTVYVRRGSSTAIADPDEIAKMGAGTATREKPKLSVLARVLKPHKAEVILAIQNAVGAGPARGPHLSFRLPDYIQHASYKLDGNGNDGLPLLPQGYDTRTLAFGGGITALILPGITHDVTRIEYTGPAGAAPGRIEIPYTLGAENADLDCASECVRGFRAYGTNLSMDHNSMFFTIACRVVVSPGSPRPLKCSVVFEAVS